MQIRRAIISRRGLALAERGDEPEEELLARLDKAFEEPFAPYPSCRAALAKGAKGVGGKTKRAAAAVAR